MGELYCEKCETINFIYEDMKPPYKCDQCNTCLDERDITEVKLKGIESGL
jgi:hypothetical protein